MAKVTGVGGVFFRARDPVSLARWYRTHLGMDVGDEGYASFSWPDGQTDERPGSTVWAVFPQNTEYFGASDQPFMVNLRVDDLDSLLQSLREAGVEVDENVTDHDFGKFGWCTDCEGNRLELWEPGPGM